MLFSCVCILYVLYVFSSSRNNVFLFYGVSNQTFWITQQYLNLVDVIESF